MPYTIDSKKL